MPFIGNQPTQGRFIELDSLSASATDEYTLKLNTANYSPESVNNLLVSINGVIQGSSTMSLNGAVLTVGATLSSSDTIDFVRVFGNVGTVSTPTDGSVTANKIGSGAVVLTSKVSGVLPVTNGGTGLSSYNSGTLKESTSGTSIDFTGIPSYAQNITVLLSGVSTNGSSNLLLQLGGSGGIETSGYLGSIGRDGGTGVITTGVGITYSLSSTHITHSQLSLWLVDASTNTWSIGSLGSGSSTGIVYFGTSSKSLSSTLDRVRVTATNGSDTFDAGKINMRYGG